MNFSQKKIIPLQAKFVKKVIKAPWLIDDNFLKLHKADLLVHGSDNQNNVDSAKLKTFRRTEGVLLAQKLRETSSRILFNREIQTKLCSRLDQVGLHSNQSEE